MPWTSALRSRCAEPDRRYRVQYCFLRHNGPPRPARLTRAHGVISASADSDRSDIPAKPWPARLRIKLYRYDVMEPQLPRDFRLCDPPVPESPTDTQIQRVDPLWMPAVALAIIHHVH
jgi:hypothetical protein